MARLQERWTYRRFRTKLIGSKTEERVYQEGRIIFRHLLRAYNRDRDRCFRTLPNGDMLTTVGMLGVPSTVKWYGSEKHVIYLITNKDSIWDGMVSTAAYLNPKSSKKMVPRIVLNIVGKKKLEELESAFVHEYMHAIQYAEDRKEKGSNPTKDGVGGYLDSVGENQSRRVEIIAALNRVSNTYPMLFKIGLRAGPRELMAIAIQGGATSTSVVAIGKSDWQEIYDYFMKKNGWMLSGWNRLRRDIQNASKMGMSGAKIREVFKRRIAMEAVARSTVYEWIKEAKTGRTD